MKRHHVNPEFVSMPCNPSEIHFQNYILPNTLGRLETEEVAARIISFSHNKIDKWVGVSWSQLVTMMKEDEAKYHKMDEMRKVHNVEMDMWFRRCQRHFWLRILTLGFYKFTEKPRPQLPILELIFQNLPFSCIFAQDGSRRLIDAIHELVEKGFLKLKEDNVKGTRIFYPTPKLIDFLLQCQKTKP